MKIENNIDIVNTIQDKTLEIILRQIESINSKQLFDKKDILADSEICKNLSQMLINIDRLSK